MAGSSLAMTNDRKADDAAVSLTYEVCAWGTAYGLGPSRQGRLLSPRSLVTGEAKSSETEEQQRPGRRFGYGADVDCERVRIRPRTPAIHICTRRQAKGRERCIEKSRGV